GRDHLRPAPAAAAVRRGGRGGRGRRAGDLPGRTASGVPAPAAARRAGTRPGVSHDRVSPANPLRQDGLPGPGGGDQPGGPRRLRVPRYRGDADCETTTARRSTDGDEGPRSGAAARALARRRSAEPVELSEPRAAEEGVPFSVREPQNR